MFLLLRLHVTEKNLLHSPILYFLLFLVRILGQTENIILHMFCGLFLRTCVTNRGQISLDTMNKWLNKRSSINLKYPV